jgi:hypothetical protein
MIAGTFSTASRSLWRGASSVTRERAKAWVPLLGFAAIALYVALTVAAVALYPGSTSPADRYLSELGNAELSPQGWLFYDLAMILAGLCALPFFVAVSRYYAKYGSKRLVRTGLVAGIVNGVSVVMAGAFAEHINMGVHVGSALVVFLSFVPMLVAYGLIFWKLRGFSRFVSVYGFVVCAIDVGLVAVLFTGGLDAGPGSIMEWVSVFTYLSWVGLVSVDLLRWQRAGGLVQRV